MTIRDELVALGLVRGDAPRDGHTWRYAQRPGRMRGVWVAIERLEPVTGEFMVKP